MLFDKIRMVELVQSLKNEQFYYTKKNIHKYLKKYQIINITVRWTIIG